MSETWNSSFKQLVGHSHPSFFNVIDNIRKDETLVKTMMLQDDRGEPPKKRIKRNYVGLQKRLKALCEDVGNCQQEIHRKIPIELLGIVSAFKLWCFAISF